MVQKLLYDMLFSLLVGQAGQQKNFFKIIFYETKFEIGSLDLFKCGRLYKALLLIPTSNIGPFMPNTTFIYFTKLIIFCLILTF